MFWGSGTFVLFGVKNIEGVNEFDEVKVLVENKIVNEFDDVKVPVENTVVNEFEAVKDGENGIITNEGEKLSEFEKAIELEKIIETVNFFRFEFKK